MFLDNYIIIAQQAHMITIYGKTIFIINLKKADFVIFTLRINCLYSTMQNY